MLSSSGGSEPNLCLRDDDSRSYTTNQLFNSVNKIVLHENLGILANDKMVKTTFIRIPKKINKNVYLQKQKLILTEEDSSDSEDDLNHDTITSLKAFLSPRLSQEKKPGKTQRSFSFMVNRDIRYQIQGVKFILVPQFSSHITLMHSCYVYVVCLFVMLIRYLESQPLMPKVCIVFPCHLILKGTLHRHYCIQFQRKVFDLVYHI